MSEEQNHNEQEGMMVEPPSRKTEWSSILESKSQSERKAHLEMLTRNLAAMEQEVKTVRESVFKEEAAEKEMAERRLKATQKEKTNLTSVVSFESSFDENESTESRLLSINEQLSKNNHQKNDKKNDHEEEHDDGLGVQTLLSSISPSLRVRGSAIVSTEDDEGKEDDDDHDDEEGRSSNNDNATHKSSPASITASPITEEKVLSSSSVPINIAPSSALNDDPLKPKQTRKPRTTRLGDRSGKWTTEEEEYARYLIECFDKGILRGPEKGTSLRSYLAKVLNCDPMRISKKYVGMMRIGKRFYRKCLSFDAEARTEIASRNLELLRRRWEMREQYRSEDRVAGFSSMYRDLGELTPMSLSLAPRYDAFNNAHLTPLPFLSHQPYWASNLHRQQQQQQQLMPPPHLLHQQHHLPSRDMLPPGASGYYPPPPPSSVQQIPHHPHHPPPQQHHHSGHPPPPPPPHGMGPPPYMMPRPSQSPDMMHGGGGGGTKGCDDVRFMSPATQKQYLQPQGSRGPSPPPSGYPGGPLRQAPPTSRGSGGDFSAMLPHPRHHHHEVQSYGGSGGRMYNPYSSTNPFPHPPSSSSSPSSMTSQQHLISQYNALQSAQRMNPGMLPVSADMSHLRGGGNMDMNNDHRFSSSSSNIQTSMPLSSQQLSFMQQMHQLQNPASSSSSSERFNGLTQNPFVKNAPAVSVDTMTEPKMGGLSMMNNKRSNSDEETSHDDDGNSGNFPSNHMTKKPRSNSHDDQQEQSSPHDEGEDDNKKMMKNVSSAGGLMNGLTPLAVAAAAMQRAGEEVDDEELHKK
jgi:hypothetical protein